MTLSFHFWEVLCFASFLALMYVYVKKPVLKYLDQYSLSIQEKIANAESLFNEAKKNLSHFQELDKEAEQKISLINKQTQDNIRLIQENSRTALAEKIATRERMQKDRMAIYERERIERIKDLVIKKALVLTHTYLQENKMTSLKRTEIASLIEVAKGHDISIN